MNQKPSLNCLTGIMAKVVTMLIESFCENKYMFKDELLLAIELQ